MITCGSETSGGIRNVEVYNIKAYGTNVGIRFKSTQGRGGTVRDIRIHDIEMKDVKRAILVDYNWHPAYNTIPEKVRKEIEEEGKELPHHWTVLMQKVPEKEGTPYIRDITIKNVNAVDSDTAFHIRGLEKQRAGSFYLENVNITAAKAGSIRNAENWIFKNVCVKAKDNSKVELVNCENMSGM